MIARKPLRGVLLDLSGTLHVGAKAIPGAVEAVGRLKASGIRIRYLTNTSTVSSTALLAQLQAMGFPITSDSLQTSVLATRHYLVKSKLRPLCLLEDTADLESGGGIELADSAEQANAVVVGLAPSMFHYQNLNAAFRVLQKKNSQLIAVHRALHVKDSSDGGISLGPGGFISCLEVASRKRAEVMGKPSTAFFESAMWDDVSLDEIAMVGDGWMEDMVGAKNARIRFRVLVKTGKYQEGDEQRCSNVTHVVADIVEAVDAILYHNETLS